MKMTIAAKIGLGFGIITIIFLSYAIKMIVSSDTSADNVSATSAIQEKIYRAGQLQYHVTNIWQFLTDASLTRDEDVISGEAKNAYDQALYNLDELKKLSGSGEYNYNMIEKEIKELFDTGVFMYSAYGRSHDEGNAAMEKYDISAEKIIKMVESIVDREKKTGTATTELVLSEARTGATVTIIISVLLILVTVIVSVVVSKQIIGPVSELNKAADHITAGDYNTSVTIKTNDEFSHLGQAFNQMVISFKNVYDDLNKEKQSIQEKVHEAVKYSEEQKNYFSGAVHNMVKVMNKFADGDLNVNLVHDKDDDVGALYKGFNKTVATMRDIVKKLSQSVNLTQTSSSEISSSTEEMAAGAQEQSAQTGEVATAIEEMTKTIIDTTRNAGTAAENAKKAGEIAGEGGKAVEATVEGMQRIALVVESSAETVKKLGRSSDEIGEIVQVIDDIADQTNLLALNAAIEAARAGEQGRGFAVVADEVRKLAERTTKATKEIAVMIKQIQADTAQAVESMSKGTGEVERGKELAARAGESLKEIIEASVKVVDDISQVATASEEQSSTAEQISKSVESISNVTNETASGIQQVARSAEDLNKLTDNLQALINRFRIDDSYNNSYSVSETGSLVKA
jgi:methyl-accepting chemotaxis protein